LYKKYIKKKNSQKFYSKKPGKLLVRFTVYVESRVTTRLRSTHVQGCLQKQNIRLRWLNARGRSSTLKLPTIQFPTPVEQRLLWTSDIDNSTFVRAANTAGAMSTASGRARRPVSSTCRRIIVYGFVWCFSRIAICVRRIWRIHVGHGVIRFRVCDFSSVRLEKRVRFRRRFSRSYTVCTSEPSTHVWTDGRLIFPSDPVFRTVTRNANVSRRTVLVGRVSRARPL